MRFSDLLLLCPVAKCWAKSSWARLFAGLVAAAVLFAPDRAVAGMPSLLTEDVQTVFRLNESPHQRFQAISFFIFGIAISTLVVRALWNYLARDFPRLPRLSYSKALALVVMWGLLFVVVLTMISGARELMTPGAWKKDGLTYSLADDPEPAREGDPYWTLKPLERIESQPRDAEQKP